MNYEDLDLKDYLDDGQSTDIEIEKNKNIQLEHLYRKLQSQYQQLEGNYRREINDYSLRLQLEEKKYKAVVKIKDEEIKKWKTKYLNDSDKWVELKNKFEDEIIRLKSKENDLENDKIIEKIKRDYQYLEKILKDKDRECKKLQRDIENKINELNETKKQLINMKNSNEREKENSKQLTKIINDFKSSTSKNNELIKTLKMENLNLKNNQSIEERSKEIFERIKVKEFASISNELKEKEIQLEKEKSSNNKLNQKIISMKKALDNMILENESLKNISSLNDLKQKEYQSNINKYKGKLEESLKNIAQKENIIGNLKEQNEKLSKELSNCDIINDELKKI